MKCPKESSSAHEPSLRCCRCPRSLYFVATAFRMTGRGSGEKSLVLTGCKTLIARHCSRSWRDSNGCSTDKKRSAVRRSCTPEFQAVSMVSPSINVKDFSNNSLNDASSWVAVIFPTTRQLDAECPLPGSSGSKWRYVCRPVQSQDNGHA
jgi:hypothetical protein